jgi:murein DD-endopeptidase MepM/ murein hydrolase activator NlpD
MPSDTLPPAPASPRARRLFDRLPRPGLTVAAAIGALTWVVAVWIGPWIAPGPRAAGVAGLDHEAALDPRRAVVAFSVPDVVPDARPKPVSRTVKVQRGDTLMTALTRAHVSHDDAYAAITALREVFNPRDLIAGAELTLNFQPLALHEGAGESFRGLEFMPSFEKTVGVARTWDNQFESYTSRTKLTHEQTRASFTIQNSLYVDAVDAGVPPTVIIEMIRALSFDVDFQRDLQPHDRFDLLYDRIKDAGGNIVGSGDVIFAALTLSGKKVEIYRFRGDDGAYDYYNPKGESTRKALMRTPIDGARLSSRYGRRRHPILGYTKVHKGIDFAAPSGTPIMAAGSGVVADARWYGAYGRYVRIRHNSTYSTAYAHMSRFAKGIRRGTRVRQGQVIGYVGSSGRSTGPHLHYEVIANNRQVNPLSVKLPTGRTLRGAERDRFLVTRMEIATAFEALLPVADAHGAGPKSRTGDNGLPKARALRAEEPPETGEP